MQDLATEENFTLKINLTEEEASRYDRQMRLWGIEAQQRMRNAVILVVRLKGVATEAIKNLVLSGVGKLIILDGEDVCEEDLGAGFFFRDEDVGKKRGEAAKARVKELNPLVTVEVIPCTSALEGEELQNIVKNVDLVCVTDWDRDGLIRMNDICRQNRKLFYCGGSYGLLGYVFCDLLTHEYLVPDHSAAKGTVRSLKTTARYLPLDQALRYRWNKLTKRQTKEVAPAVMFTLLAIWEFESLQGRLPANTDIRSLEEIANKLVLEADINEQILAKMPEDLIHAAGTTAAHEFSPVCAIIGGILGQDILKALGGRDPPIANFFIFNGNTGGGTVCRMNMP